jgi:hypothetical protein
METAEQHELVKRFKDVVLPIPPRIEGVRLVDSKIMMGGADGVPILLLMYAVNGGHCYTAGYALDGERLVQHGNTISYWPSGRPQFIRTWKMGMMDGLELSFDEYGRINYMSFWMGGQREGDTTYYESGTIVSQARYERGAMVERVRYASPVGMTMAQQSHSWANLPKASMGNAKERKNKLTGSCTF